MAADTAGTWRSRARAVGFGRNHTLALAAVGFLLALVLLPVFSAAAQETGGTDETAQATPGQCIECHAFVSQDVVNSWQAQNHGQNGVGCPVCHHSHDEDFRPEPTAC